MHVNVAAATDRLLAGARKTETLVQRQCRHELARAFQFHRPESQVGCPRKRPDQSGPPDAGVATALAEALAGAHAAVNVQSGGLLVLGVSGPAAPDLLAAGCPMDLDATSFGPGCCAQTGLAKASVLIAAVDSRPSFDVIVRRSFAEYLALWLEHAGGELGVDFVLE